VNLLDLIPGALATLSFLLLLWQWLVARRFPLHRRATTPGFSPAVTLLKPLKGADATTIASFESWFQQDYAGPVQILFGIADADDPAGAIVRELLKKYPRADAQLVVCRETLGANAKVSTLIQLEKLVKHPLVLVSDADVRVPPDFLANVVAPLADDGVGLVNCFYRLANPVTAAMRWEAVAINADFWSQVLQSQALKPLDFALGAVMLTRRSILQEIGGFASFADCLADDYQLGNRVAGKGHRLTLCPVVVECWDSPKGWRDVWRHQLRWARTIRACQPAPYFFSILSNASFWPLLWLLVEAVRVAMMGGRIEDGAVLRSFLLALVCGLLAIAFLSTRIAVAQDLQRRFCRDRKAVAPFWLVPVKDGLQAAIWFLAFTGDTIEWRGRKMRLRPDGTLEKI